MLANSVGIDIIEVDRINEAIAEWKERFLNKVFTANELEYCKGNTQSLAARFACKEAVTKAFGMEFLVHSWKDIEVLVSSMGSPYIVLHGESYIRARQTGFGSLSVSLSHCSNYAIAICYVN